MAEHDVSEIIDSMIGDMASDVVKSVIKAAFGGLFSAAGDPWKRRVGAMFLGTPHTDEQMYWLMLTKAETSSSPEKIDQYLIEVAKLTPAKQNLHQINTVQSWIAELLKKDSLSTGDIEIIINAGASVIANHAERIARNPDAWRALTKIQDVDQPVLRHDFRHGNEEMRKEIAALKEEEQEFYSMFNPFHWFARRPRT